MLYAGISFAKPVSTVYQPVAPKECNLMKPASKLWAICEAHEATSAVEQEVCAVQCHRDM